MIDTKFKVGDSVWYYDSPHIFNCVVKGIGRTSYGSICYSIDLFYEELNETIDVSVFEDDLYSSKSELVKCIVSNNDYEIQQLIEQNETLYEFIGLNYVYEQ